MHTFVDPPYRAQKLFGYKVAMVCGNVRLTYAETWSRCRRLAGGLAKLGMQPGDRVALLAANSHQYLEVYMAVPAAGYVVVPLNTRHAVPELRYALEDSGARLLISDRGPGVLRDTVEHVISLPEGYETLLADAAEAELGEGVSAESLAGLFYTGGTTGASKGVMLSHQNLMANATNWLIATQQGPEHTYLVMAPLFHAAGSLAVLATVWTGGCQVVLPTFDPVVALDVIEAEQVTATLGVPTMIAAMAEEQLVRPRQVACLRRLGHGGSPIATEVVRRAHAAFPGAELLHLYGATETAPLATGLRHEEELVDGELGRSCGQAVTGVDVRVCDQAGHERLPGGIGEIVVRGPNVMQGYWNKPEQTAEVLRNGWYYTGDLGYMNEHGYLFLVDRAKDMIVSGGENVYSTEVEEVLYRHAAVLEAAVFGVPDQRWGEAVHAVVVPRPGHEVDAAGLIAFCRESIAGYKIPRQIDLRSEPLPKSGPGKVLKRELRAPFWEGRATQVH
ncbi:3-[(3aS,4S,7aS)-7a-methyl-1,5-dioxo-octahydro-1H-inden-4-yl]propanoyl:CoA ligase [Candidatus Entotheonellaceae bacterium PAL068K]